MDISVEEFVDGLISKQAHETPSDGVAPEEIEMKLPDNFNEARFNQGRRFYWDHCFALSTSMLLGLVAVFSVPSILRILVSTRKSNSTFTAFRRYVSTLLHSVSWFEHELKPGSLSWKSLNAVRTRHAKATMAAKVKGLGVVSQRDIALTQFGFVGFSVLKPDRFGVRQLQRGDWDSYVYFWRVIGHMIGLEDRYNICRSTYEETRQVCQMLLERVFTPALENVPEYFEHAARVMLDGMWSTNPTVNADAMLFMVRNLSDVPGYVYTEEDRRRFQHSLRKRLHGKPEDTGVDSSVLMRKPSIDGLPSLPPRMHYLRDYDSVESAPAYKQLSFVAKYKIAFYFLQSALYSIYCFRLYFNWNFIFSIWLIRNFPYLGFFRFGIKESFVNIFKEDVTDNTELVPNAEYYKNQNDEAGYKKYLSLLWK